MRGLRRWWSRWWQTLGIVWTTGAFVWDVACGIVIGRWWYWAWAALMVACLVVQVHSMRASRRLRMARAIDGFDEPLPPENVRLHQPDGTIVPVELVYGGWIDGAHQWVAVTPVRPEPGAALTGMIPAHTAIVLRMA